MSEHSKEQFIKPADGRLYIHLNAVIQIAMLSVCIIVLYWSVVPGLIKSWDFDSFPGFIVPLASIFIIWRKRHDLRKVKRSSEIWGLFIMVIGGLWLFLGRVSAVSFISCTSSVIVLIGLVLYILGWEYFKLLSFPLLFLFLMVRTPSIFLGFVVHKLQLISAYFGTLGLHVFNVPFVLEGNSIHLPETTVVVAEACAGMRYVFSTTILAVFIAYLTQKTWSSRVLYMVVAILIAVATNIVRVAGAAAMAHFISVKMISGIYHAIHGWIMFLFSYGGLIGTAILFSRISRENGEVTEYASTAEYEV